MSGQVGGNIEIKQKIEKKSQSKVFLPRGMCIQNKQGAKNENQ